MLFPDKAKQAIAKAFYDKAVVVSTRTTTLDAEGGIVKGNLTQKASFNANVQFTNLGELQSELGLTESIDIVISCPTSANVALTDVITYNGVNYDITAVIPFDAYIKVVGKKCLA